MTGYAAECGQLQDDYIDCWSGLNKNFDPEPARARNRRLQKVKLASFKHGRDGRLVVVSRDLARAADASAIVPTLQSAIDNWADTSPRLRDLADRLEPAMPFLRSRSTRPHCAAPLPRAYQWLDGSAYVNHVALVRQARGAVARIRSGPIR